LDLTALLKHEHGLWAVAPYLRDWLLSFAASVSESARQDFDPLGRALDVLLADDSQEAEKALELQHVVDQVWYQAQLHDPECCKNDTFREWLVQRGDMRTRVHYVIAVIDHIQSAFVSSVTTEIQELRSLRKALLANWRMLCDLRQLSDSGSPEGSATVAAVEDNLLMMFERATALIRMYEQT